MDSQPETLRSFRLRWMHLVLLLGVVLLVIWLNAAPAGLLGKADAVGYAVCHRIDLRSFHLGERQLPMCARCSGIYLGAMLGLLFQSVLYPRCGSFPGRKVLAFVVVFGLAFAVDGLNSYLALYPGAPGLYEPDNLYRLLTGTGLGIAMSAVLVPAFNQTVWKDWQPKAAFTDMRMFLLLLLLGLGLDGLVLLENPLLLYPLALISAVGVLVILTMVYGMAAVLALRKENAYLTWRELLLPLALGFILAMVQIGLIDAGRFLLTGTWDGFHLG